MFRQHFFDLAVVVVAFTTLTIIIPKSTAFSNTGTYPYDKCTKAEYYETLLAENENPSDWTPESIRLLITESHRNVLDNVAPTKDGDDILQALHDLWPGQDDEQNALTDNNTVRVLYRDVDFPANIANTQLGWEREDLWPRQRGWDFPDNLDAWTDIYGKAPADSTVRVAKRTLFFGLCGTVESQDACIKPATSETAPTTEQDGKIFAPPDRYKGDVARALFYFAARYYTSLNLTLTDCPPFETYEFGYLSELLRWHQNDPVSEEERIRNDRGCSRWQGNRNPFVDYPELVLDVFYVDYVQGGVVGDTIIPDTNVYSRCTSPTNPPTSTRVACNDLESGDLPIFLFNSIEPDQIVFVPLVDLPESLGSLYMTDSAWNGTQFLDNEGTYEVRVFLGVYCFVLFIVVVFMLLLLLLLLLLLYKQRSGCTIQTVMSLCVHHRNTSLNSFIY